MTEGDGTYWEAPESNDKGQRALRDRKERVGKGI